MTILNSEFCQVIYQFAASATLNSLRNVGVNNLNDMVSSELKITFNFWIHYQNLKSLTLHVLVKISEKAINITSYSMNLIN